MNLHLKAAGIAALVVGSGLCAGFLFSFLPNWAVAAIVVLGACFIVYKTALSSLKYDEAVKDISKKYE